ncbi:MAG TPA: MFS transporter [Gammaproteobacteria bacterium]|nr:MFS transporter [Gammaproteobacteria bacterium]
MATRAIEPVIDERASDPRKLRRIVLAMSAGTVFEAYDFILFGSLAPLISRQFFSGVNETAAFIFALLTFAAGFAIRPLGALVFGRMGDKHGRKRAFLITITLMGLSTFGIGLLPTYAAAGVLAPVLLIALRLVQGLAFGGEYGGAVVYTAEHAPERRRGLYVGWIQTAAGFALFASFLVLYLTRTAAGEARFEAWAWRVPFLISLLLLVISLWIRLRLEESPLFRKMIAEGRRSKAPLKEAFLEWPNLKQVLAVLFGLMAVQGVSFYTAHFYSQFFLTQILKVDGATVTFVMMVVTAASFFLYVLFSWLSDKIGRKTVILTGAVLTVVTTFPLYHALTRAANPAAAAATRSSPVVVVADPGSCSVQFDPIGRSLFVSSCDIAKGTLARLGIPYTNEAAAAGTLAAVRVGGRTVASVDGRGLGEDALAASRAAFEARLGEAVAAAGYAPKADPARIDVPLVTVLVFLMVAFAVMVYAPMAAMAIEVFPTRIRYSALSLPYHIGSGWFGGFLPAIAFAMVAASGDIYIGLWYPVGVCVLGIVVLAFFLPETKNRDIARV